MTRKRSQTALLFKNTPQWVLKKKSEKTEPALLTESFQDWVKTLRIKTSKGVKGFHLYDWQSDFVDLLLASPRTPITLLSSRQTGKTADLLAVMVYLALSREQFTGLFVHRKTEDAHQLARRIKKMLPSSIRLATDNLGLLEFKRSGSSLYFRSANHKQSGGAEGSARGVENIDVIVIEEASHTLNTQEVIGVVGPTMTHSSMANIVLVGTSGRRTSYFYETLLTGFGGKDALEGTLDKIRKEEVKPYQVSRSGDRLSVITNWRAIPEFLAEGHDENGYPNYLHRIKKEQDLTDAQIASEHELYFDADESSSVFTKEQVEAATSGEWEPASLKRQYFAGVDGSGKPRAGRKGDYTVCVVVEKVGDRTKVVNLYRKRNISFQQRYEDIARIINDYRPDLTYCEANDGLGQTYEENLLTLAPGQLIERFVNSAQKKALAINTLELALEKGSLTIPRSPILGELLNFSRFEDGTMGSIGKDMHDDTVMALAMALMAASAKGLPVRPFAKIDLDDDDDPSAIARRMLW